MLNYFGWLLVVLGVWKETNQKIWFKSKKSDFNQINPFLFIFLNRNNRPPCRILIHPFCHFSKTHKTMKHIPYINICKQNHFNNNISHDEKTIIKLIIMSIGTHHYNRWYQEHNHTWYLTKEKICYSSQHFFGYFLFFYFFFFLTFWSSKLYFNFD